MKSLIKKTNYRSLMTLGLILISNFCINFSQAAPPPPEALIPPLQNPHPPQTEAEKKRVQFAEAATQLLLVNKPSLNKAVMFNVPPTNFQNKDLACLKSNECYQKDDAIVYELQHFHALYGPIQEMKHAHVIPWSWENFQKNSKTPTAAKTMVMDPSHKKMAAEPMSMGPTLKADEYMVHIYVRFNPGPHVAWEGWYHLDVILTENENGEISLRHFYIAPLIPDLPPGVVC